MARVGGWQSCMSPVCSPVCSEWRVWVGGSPV